MLGYGESGTDHDFFVYDANGDVWNGSAFVTWVDGDYQTYRVAATEVGSTGRFEDADVSGAANYELRERAATLADSVVVWTEDVVTKTEIKRVPRSASESTPGGDITRSKQSANSSTLVERLS
jgi:hypothetical protein